MDKSVDALTAQARRAVQAKDWAAVAVCAKQLLENDRGTAEGYFLLGLKAKASLRMQRAADRFQQALDCDAGRYDAAVELASVCYPLQRHSEANALLDRYAPQLASSPVYLDSAGRTYAHLGMHEKSMTMFERANALQPGVDSIRANLAAAAVNVGRLSLARELYAALLQRYPTHQRNHYELARLGRATDDRHMKQMLQVLERGRLPPEKNIFLHFAIGKELEDLERWDDAFFHYKKANDAVSRVARYDVSRDVAMMERITATCTAEWLAQPAPVATQADKTPLFIVGLPRTGTTLVERIVSSHSQVDSAGESRFVELALLKECDIGRANAMSARVIRSAAARPLAGFGKRYLDTIAYRLGEAPFFVDKLPENVLYLGFIARAFPQARLVLLDRHPMDACFAIYKQSYFKFSYTLDALGRYYIAYDRLRRHWRDVLGARLVEVSYETLVGEPEAQIRRIIDQLGLEFESQVLNFDENPSASATASAAQVRSKIHTGSVGRWRHFQQYLQPLREALEAAGIEI